MIDCRGIEHVVTVSPNNGGCYCKDNYVWDAVNKKCMFDCKAVPHSTGQEVSK